ncbi:MAG: hypothetical protein PW789_02690 [Edaphobacter sp.]|uniref:hypothetical protein n=1 Tax=Edaphobacter sp. TaxID=1934404 RepID=UPI00239810DB|nr:hypothetical protein [Edaphobacter sp.]MDE1175492.1 hypothetical protein [Edaphobacter sp.]
MAKRILPIALVVFVAIFAYVGYHSYDTKRSAANGSAAKIESTQHGDEDDSEPIVYPHPAGASAAASALQPSATASAAEMPAGQSVQPEHEQPQVTQSQQPTAENTPANDTIRPNPPNGMTFAGSGRYQLYRQGNLTWRLDTETGHTCVLFATDGEWRKAKVYRAGCGRN